MGHSLGGVVATWEWIDQSYAAVALIASFPADTSRLLGTPNARSLFIVGSEDRRVDRDTLRRGFAVFAGQKLLATVDGMNHYDWTDGATASELSTDGASTRPIAQSRRDAWRVIDAWADTALRDDPAAQQQFASGTFAGVQVQR
jgi:hypothetical protein